MRIILYGDSYYIRTVIRCLDYTHPDCSEIFLVNDRIADKISYSSKYNIGILTDHVLNDGCIDELLVVASQDIRSLLPDCIVNSKPNRKIIRVDQLPSRKYSSKIFDEFLLKVRPSILSLSIGDGSQQYFSELLINQKLKERSIHFYQQFSPETAYLLSNKGFNSPIAKENVYSKNYDIFVGGVSINHSQDLLNLNLPACKAIQRMHPDSAIISCCNAPSLIENDIKEAINILHYQYRIKEIIVIVSEYYCNSNVTFPMRTEYRYSDSLHDTFYLADIDFYQNEEIVDRLLSPVYLPDGFVSVE